MRCLSRLVLALSAGLGLAAAPALAAPPQVVADVPPVASLAAAVLGDLGQPEVLIGQGSEPHGHAMRPSEARALEQAGLVLWVGPELTPWLDKARTALAPDAPELRLLPEAPVRRDLPEGEADPHAWLDPANAAAWLDAIAARLAALDPENAQAYRANAAAGKARIAQAREAAETALAPVAGRPFLTYHDGFGYFAGAFDLALSGAVASGEGERPGPAALSALKARAGDIVCLFTEPAFDDRLAQLLAEGTKMRLAELDPLGLSLAPGAGLYPALIEGLASEVAACLEG